MKTALLLFIVFNLTIINAQLITINTPGDLLDSIGTTNYIGSVSVGTSSSTDVVFYMGNQSVSINGTFTLGGVSSRPVLDVKDGIYLTVEGFNMRGGIVEGDGVVVVLEDMSFNVGLSNGNTGNIRVHGGLTVAGSSILNVGENGTLMVMGSTSLGQVINVNAGGSAVFMGDMSGYNDLVVAGSVMFDNPEAPIAVSCGMQVDSGATVTVMSEVSLTDDIRVSGSILVSQGAKLAVSESSVTLNGEVNSSGTLTFTTAFTPRNVYPTLNINGGGSVNGKFNIYGPVNLNSDLECDGNTFYGLVDIMEGNTLSMASGTFGHDVVGKGQISINGTVSITQSSKIEPNINVDAGSVLQLDGYLLGTTTLNGELQVRNGNEGYVNSIEGSGEITVFSSLYINGSESTTIGCLIDNRGTIFVVRDTTFQNTVDNNNYNNPDIEVQEGATATFSGALLMRSTRISVFANAKAVTNGNITFIGYSNSYIYVYGAMDINGPVFGTYGTLSFESSDPTAISTINTEVLEASFSITKNASVVSKGNTNYTQLTTQDSSSFTVEGRSFVKQAIRIQENSTIAFASTGFLYGYGSFSLGEESTYKVSGATESSENYLRVAGSASLAGHLVVETSVSFTRETKLTIMTYGSRTFTTTFDSITVNGNKRALEEDGEYEVVYADNEAYVRLTYTGELNSSSVSYVFSIALMIAALIFN